MFLHIRTVGFSDMPGVMCSKHRTLSPRCGQVKGVVEMLLENNCNATGHRWSGAKEEGWRGCAAQGKIAIIYTLL